MAQLNAGTGADGSATVSTNTNINTTSLVGRGYADMVAYSITALTDTGCTTSVAPDGIVVGDTILLVSTQGPGDIAQVDNVGNWEILKIDSVNGTSIGFLSNKVNDYGNNGGDTNIGTGTAECKVMIQRIPQYENLTIDNGYSLLATPWDYAKYGVICIMVSDTLTVNGSITVTGQGFRGGGVSYVAAEKVWGGSYGRNQIFNQYNLGGGQGFNAPSGGGGAYGTVGYGGASIYGDEALVKIYLGSGGGGAYSGNHKAGGPGAGMVMLFCGTLHSYGTISANGANGLDDAGGGSGGSVLIQSGLVDLHSSTLTALQANRAGKGRIAIYYNSLVGSITSDPAAYTDDTLELPYSVSGVTSAAATIYVMDSSMTKLTQDTVSAGSYEISNLPSSGPFHVIGIPTASGSGLLGYRDIVPSQ